MQRKFRTRNVRYFDLDDGRGGRFHPNIRVPVPLVEKWRYVVKEGNFVEAGDRPAKFLLEGEQRLGKRDAAFAALDADNDTVEDFMSALRQRHPYEFFTRGATIRANVEQVKRHRWNFQPTYPADSFVLPGSIQDWLDTEFDEEVSKSYLSILGEACCAAATRGLAQISCEIILIDSGFQHFLTGKGRTTKIPHARRPKQNGENALGKVAR